MSDLIQRAIHFATAAHERIDQRRKYSGQPYTDHLKQVANIVSTVTADEETIAAAWLHDVVEDTPATIDEIEREFGPVVAGLVHALTDVSKPSDGNRAERKAIDRIHLAKACNRAQTIKLADLIDNCQDIIRHDHRFARVYLEEMDALLEVLVRADPVLMRRARKTLAKCLAQLDEVSAQEKYVSSAAEWDRKLWQHFKQEFNQIFTARDIAELVELSFDAEMPASQATAILQRKGFNVAIIRLEGEITGYTTLEHLANAGSCGMALRHFAPNQVVTADAGFAEVIYVLTRYDHCFVSQYGQVLGIITRGDVNKPYMRMWLFGIITLIEMRITVLIRHHLQHHQWQNMLPPARLEAARKLYEERRRLGQECDLIDCLQMADKGLLLIQNEELFTVLGFTSKSAAKKILKQFQSLRNNLAHAQDISTYDWAQIARLAHQMLE